MPTVPAYMRGQDHSHKTLDRKIAASLDDGMGNEFGGFNNTNTYMSLGSDVSIISNRAFTRFIEVTLGGTVTRAYLEYSPVNNYTTNNLNLTIAGIDQDNPTQIADNDDLYARPLTAQTVAWDGPGSWTSGTYKQTPDISAIIQELIDSYTISNDAVMLIVYNDTGLTEFANVATYDRNENAEVKLHVEYRLPNTTQHAYLAGGLGSSQPAYMRGSNDTKKSATYQINTGANDFQWDTNQTFDATGSWLYVGSAPNTFNTGLFFNEVKLLGVIITSYIQFSVSVASCDHDFRFYAVDQDNPSVPTSHSEADGKPLTSAYVVYNPGSMAFGYNDTASLNSILQELVDSYTIDGDRVGIYWKGDGADTDWFQFRAFEQANEPARLVVTSGVPGSVQRAYMEGSTTAPAASDTPAYLEGGSTSGISDIPVYLMGATGQPSIVWAELEVPLPQPISSILAFLKGEDHETSGLPAFTQGNAQAASALPAYAAGWDHGLAALQVYTSGRDNALSAQPAYLVGNQDQSAAVPAYLKGHDHGTTSQSVYTRGHSTAQGGLPAYLAGGLEGQTSVPAFTSGLDVASSQTPAYLEGSEGQPVSSQVAYLVGQADGLDNLPVYSRGQDEGQVNIPAYVQGEDHANDAQSAYLQGLDNLTGLGRGYLYGLDSLAESLSGYLRGQLGLSGAQGGYALGGELANASRAAFLAGGSPAEGQASAYLAGQDAGQAAQTAYLASEDASSSSQEGYTLGSDVALSHNAAFAYGEGFESSPIPAFLEGYSANASAKIAFLVGQDIAKSSIPAYLAGGVTSSTPAYLSGGEDVTATLPAHLLGSADLSLSLQAFLQGQSSTGSVTPAFTAGEAGAESQQPVYTGGQSQGNSQEASFLAGSADASTAQHAYLMGVTGVSRQHAYLSGLVYETASQLPAYLKGERQATLVTGEFSETVSIEGQFLLEASPEGEFSHEVYLEGEFILEYNIAGSSTGG